jgi:hypothetical protein
MSSNILSWTLDAIREEGVGASWMEEKRYDWVPMVGNIVSAIIAGSVVLVVTDSKRKWFGDYIRSSINRPEKNRPLLPFYSVSALFPAFNSLKMEELDHLYDLFDVSFKNYVVFYVGRGADMEGRIAKKRNDSFMWLIDEQMPGALYLADKDGLDTQLLTLYKIFDKTIDAVLFGEITLEG